MADCFIEENNVVGTGSTAWQLILNVAIRRLDDEQRTGLCIDLYQRLNDEGKDAVKKYCGVYEWQIVLCG